MTLFDPGDYPSPNDKERRRRRTRKVDETVPSDGYWHIITSLAGPLDYCHRIDPFAPGALAAQGSTLTRCGQTGRKLHTPERGAVIRPCPQCRLITGQ